MNEIEERNAGLERQKRSALPARNTELTEEIAFNSRLPVRIRLLKEQAKDEVRSMADPKARYSAVALAWIKANLERL